MRAADLFCTLSMDAAPAPASAEADVAEPDDDDANDEAEARRKTVSAPGRGFPPCSSSPFPTEVGILNKERSESTVALLH